MLWNEHLAVGIGIVPEGGVNLIRVGERVREALALIPLDEGIELKRN